LRFSGTGVTPFVKLGRYLQHNTRSKDTPRHKAHDTWKSNISAKIERALDHDGPRRFCLADGIVYQPDHILSHTIQGKKVIIQVDEEKTDQAIARYKSFMKMLGNAYFVIAVVRGEYLRQWNEADGGAGIQTDEIWVGDDVSDLIERIKNPRDRASLTATCTACGRIARDPVKIKRYFPYRIAGGGSVVAERQCRVCKQANESSKTEYAAAKSHKCIGCGEVFETRIASELYCFKCTEKIRS